MMWIHTCAKGSGAYAFPENFGKNVAICRILSVPKYVIINLKINNFKDNISTIIIKKSPYLSPILIQMSMSICTFEKGGLGWGDSPTEANIF